MELSKKIPCRILLLILTLSLFLLYGGCSSVQTTNIGTGENKNSEKAALDLAAKKLFREGMVSYTAGRYYTAVKDFEKILDNYPFSQEAKLANLRAADCNYYLKRYLAALTLYKVFEDRHPTNENIPYVMFQEAMCAYKRIDRIDRDTSGASEAVELFRRLLNAYPDSPYIGEAKIRLATATEFLANHEYFVADFYVRTHKDNQAKIRLRYLLAMYPETKIAAKAKKLLSRLEAKKASGTN